MPEYTDFLNLSKYSGSELFLDQYQGLAGTSGSSNMDLIDSFASESSGSIANLSAYALTHESEIANLSASALTHESEIANLSASALTHESEIANLSASALTHESEIANLSASAITADGLITNISASVITPIEGGTPNEIVVLSGTGIESSGMLISDVLTEVAGSTIMSDTTGSQIKHNISTIIAGSYTQVEVDKWGHVISGSITPFLDEIYLTTMFSSTNWDGDARSTTSKTKIDLSSIFGAPAGIKAVYVNIAVRDSGSASNPNLYFGLAPNNTADVSVVTVRPSGLPNDYWANETCWVPCDENGDVYFQCVASGTGTMDVYIQIWGYKT